MNRIDKHYETWRIWPDGETEQVGPSRMEEEQAERTAETYTKVREHTNARWLAMAVRVHGGEPRYTVVKVTTYYEEVKQ